MCTQCSIDIINDNLWYSIFKEGTLIFYMICHGTDCMKKKLPPSFWKLKIEHCKKVVFLD